MTTMTTESMKVTRSGWNTCAICHQYVSGGFWTKYAHCVKHAWHAVMPIVQLVGLCFGIFA